MSEKHEGETYTISIEGHLGQQWTTRFEGMTIALTEDGKTLLTGALMDQAALHGLLRTIRDAGLELVAVNRAANEASSE